MNAAFGRFPVARSVVIYIRSLAFNVLFYVNLIAHMIMALPTLALPYPCLRVFIRSYARTSLWLLRVVCGTKVEWRGVEKIPKGSCIVACKHQSLWETFSLYALLDDPVYVLKRELMWLPLFGWYMRKAGLIPIDRSAGMAALARMTARARQALMARRVSSRHRDRRGWRWPAWTSACRIRPGCGTTGWAGGNSSPPTGPRATT